MPETEMIFFLKARIRKVDTGPPHKEPTNKNEQSHGAKVNLEAEVFYKKINF